MWAHNNCGCRNDLRGLPLGPCGLCALWRLHHAGVSAGKIAGRQANVLRKLASVQLVRAVLGPIRTGCSQEDSWHTARTLRQIPSLCRWRGMCYFRETRWIPAPLT